MKLYSSILFLFILFTKIYSEETKKIGFNKHIRPILSEYCFSCHGPDAKHAKGDLRLHTLESALEGKAFVPGKPNESEMIHRIMTDDVDDIMPPLKSHKKLNEKEKQLLKQWIAEGAKWEEHWAFIKPKKVKPFKEQNPIDYYVQKKLKDVGLKQNVPLDRYALARRTSFDLIGLPPSLKEVEDFVNDNSKDAYKKYVDQLLKKEAYGEHQARYWMDAARYGDTHGLHLDNYREIWPYRDWVINAFNKNMPYDKFTVEQIAGDLLPNRTQDQRIATGFNRCNVTTSEGGSIPEELKVRYMVDRVETVGTVYLGLTMGCASCHDHKFDPISQKEFYQFAAFFNNTTEPALDGNQKDTPPTLTIPKAKYMKEWEALLKQRTVEFVNIDKRQKIAPPNFWWKNKKFIEKIQTPIRYEALNFEALVKGKQPRLAGKAIKLTGLGDADPKHPSGKAAGVMIGGKNKSGVSYSDSPVMHSKKPFAVSMWIRTPKTVRNSGIFKIAKKNLGITVTLNVQGGIKADVNFSGKTLSGYLSPEVATMPNSWQHLCIRYSGGQSKTSIRIAMNGLNQELRIGDQALSEGEQSFKGGIRIGENFLTGGVSHVRFYNRWVNEDELVLLANEFRINEILSKANNQNFKISKADRKLMRTLYQETLDKNLLDARKVIAKTQTRRDYIYARSTTTLITEEKKNTKPVAYILERGEYDKRGEKVLPQIPKLLHKFNADYPQNRFGLAKWLVDANNPLTARVTINRLWESLFGRGLIKTAGDFGTMGDRPSHPELLDWLAVEFMASGWDIQHMLRLMISSKTYQQNGVVSTQSLKIDPENKWYSRGPRVRLDAEEIRDQALAVSGLLKLKIGGPSVRPYQPLGLWKAVGFASSNTNRFRVDKGEKLYRRSLYTFWKRTSPPPSLEAFNAPNRENCKVSRERTNTPLQALVLMNDPQYVEAARYLAQRTLKLKESSDEDKLAWMLRETLKRPCVREDINELLQALINFRKHFKNSPKIADNIIKVGAAPRPKGVNIQELASWTMIANVLMNRDDFINKD